MGEGLLIAAPLRVEAALIGSAARGVSVHKTGMGPERAKAAARLLAGKAGGALLVLGFCGGLDGQSVPGEVIVAEEVRAAADEGHPPQRVACAHHGDLVEALRAPGMTIRSGSIVCVSKLALGQRREELLADGALAVDMESVWLAAGAAGRPFAVVRVVLDSPSHELLHPRAALAAIRAARALRRAAAAVRAWTPTATAPRSERSALSEPSAPLHTSLHTDHPGG